ncbi:MAG: hypothetical protein IEMM0008_1884 [bacterium]|nr:MAG: hypothetical protein IEMM0008_1884 [bacterium]
MVNTFNIQRILVLAFTLTFILVCTRQSFAQRDFMITQKDTNFLSFDFQEDKPILEGKRFPKILLPSKKIEEEYQESSFRRFEIIFFLSLPFVFGYQLLLNQVLASNATINGQSGSLSNQQWLYMGMASLLMATGVAYSDYIEVSKSRDIDMSASSSAYFKGTRQITFS